MHQPNIMMDPRIEAVILRMTTDFRDPLTLAELAKSVCLSAFYFHRLFKMATHETPAGYLNRIRLEHAAHLVIALPDVPLIQIALDSGFSSAATFSRSFQQFFQLSPSHYRKINVQGVNRVPTARRLELRILPTRYLSVQRCALDECSLTEAYRRLIVQQMGQPTVGIGIFVDAPFHHERSSCRHYLAIETPLPQDRSNTFCLPGGLYAQFTVQGDLDTLSAAMVAFNHNQLEPSLYTLGSTLAFERVTLPADPKQFCYSQHHRQLFFKVRRKYEPVI